MDSHQGDKRAEPILGNIKNTSVMKLYEFKATTGYSGFIIRVGGWYATKKTEKILAERAFADYKRQIEADASLSRYPLKICIFNYLRDDDGIFRLVVTDYKNYELIDGKVVFTSWDVVVSNKK